MAEARAGTPAQTPTSPWSYYPDPDFENSEAAQNPFLRCPYRNHWKADHQLAVRSQERWEAGRRVLHHRLQPSAAAPGPAAPEENLERATALGAAHPRARQARYPPAAAGAAKDLAGAKQTSQHHRHYQERPEMRHSTHSRGLATLYTEST